MAAGHGWRYLLVDVDGTLLNSQGQVTPRTHAALARAVRAGLQVVLASGRTYPSLMRVAGSLQVPFSLIANGGAAALGPRDQAVRYLNPLPAALWPRLVEALAEAGLSVVVFRHRHPEPPLLLVSTPRGDPHYEAYLGRHTLANQVLPDLAQAAIPDVLEVAALGRGAAFDRASAQVMERFRGATRHHSMALYINAAYGKITEFFEPGTSKWRAFLGLFPQAASHPQQVIAVGDEANDAEMVAAAGMGIAMGNATPELKALARHVTASHDEEGLAQALEALLPG